MSGPLLQVEGVSKVFRGNRTRHGLGPRDLIRAVDQVSFTLAAGSTLAIVGESGCGKSTLAKLLLRFEEPTAGRVRFDGRDIVRVPRAESRRLRRRIQPVLQDPYGSLNPRRIVFDAVSEPWQAFREIRPPDRRVAAAELLGRVGLGESLLDRHPGALSGGQRQRVNIARALAARPDLLVLDEPLSALDVSMQAQIVNLLRRLQDELSIAYVFITHDLSLVPFLSDQVAVMYLGSIVETGPVDEVFSRAVHPYTQALLSAVPSLDPTGQQRIVLHGDVPSPGAPPSGCRFRTRCWRAQPECAERRPELVDRGYPHPSACHFAEPLTTGDQRART
ncbi:MAG: ATP-binding cassette domain-containing protein [Micromonosporaceae bacterium]|nr:ATP-binding cassette domain-containing protein [Micromonosporaceae bacterium]